MMFSWCKSAKLLWVFMVPLVLLFAIVVLVGTKDDPSLVFLLTFSSAATSSSYGSGSSSLGGSGKFSDSTTVVIGNDDMQHVLVVDRGFAPSPSPSPPPLQPEAVDVVAPPSVARNKMSIFDVILNGTVFSSSMERTRVLPLNKRLRRKQSSLDKLEAGLRRARAEIWEARQGNQTSDPDYVPYGPIYRNPSAFHRSYLEMEKQFKVFVYEEGEPPIFHDGPCKSIYSMEGNFIYDLETSKFRTRDPNKAHVYFLPISMTSVVRFIRSKHDWAPLKRVVRDYVNLIARKYPFWNRSIGADHFMLACHDWGPELSRSVPDLFKNSIRALCNANTSEGFKPSSDVSIPEILLPRGTLDGLLGGPSASHRPILVFFAGGLHGPIRPILLEHWENKDEEVQVHKYLPKGVSYYGMLRKSKYCICPSGYEVASPRMVEALYTGCVPVLIKDHYVAPFSDVLNWKSFSVEIPVNDIPNLKKILTSISSRQYIKMQRRGKQVRRHFELNLPPKRYDVFHMILHSVWLRRLNVRIRGVDSL